MIERKAQKKFFFPDRKPRPPIKSCGPGYSMLIHLMLTRGARSLEDSEKFVRKETALWSALL